MLSRSYCDALLASKKRKRSQSPESSTSALATADPNIQKREPDQDANKKRKTHALAASMAAIDDLELNPAMGGRYPGEPNWLLTSPPLGVTTAITVTFPKEKCAFVMIDMFLSHHFDYFESALSIGRVVEGQHNWLEGDKKQFDIEEISSTGFGRILAYLERHYRVGDKMGQSFHYKPEPVHDLLQGVIAADYLGLKDFRKFEDHIAQLLGFSLMMNRLRLNPAVLMLVTSHDAFRSGVIWDVCVKAAVRVRLRSAPTEQTPDRYRWVHEKDFTADEYTGKCSWDEIRAHYRKMQRTLSWYGEAVKQAVTQTLNLRSTVARRRRQKIKATDCEDPLAEYTRLVHTISPDRTFKPLPNVYA